MPAKIAKVRWTCPICKKTRWYKPFDVKNRKACSRGCAYQSLRVENPVRKVRSHVKKTYGEAICPGCEQPFIKKTAHQKFCRRDCQLIHIHERRKDIGTHERPCEYCGTLFRPRPGNAGRFHTRACLYKGARGEKAAHWRGGRNTTGEGYVRIYQPEHPEARGHGGYVAEHRLVMEKMIGRVLESHETPHHKNGQRDDNRPGNLELWVKHQPPGQRVEDLLEWAKEIIRTYQPIVQKLRAYQPDDPRQAQLFEVI